MHLIQYHAFRECVDVPYGFIRWKEIGSLLDDASAAPGDFVGARVVSAAENSIGSERHPSRFLTSAQLFAKEEINNRLNGVPCEIMIVA